MFRTDGYPDLGPRWGSDEPIRYIGLAGVPVTVASVFELVRRLRQAELHETAEILIDAWVREQPIVSLDRFDSEALLLVLRNVPEELAGLRGVLLREQIRRHTQGR